MAPLVPGSLTYSNLGGEAGCCCGGALSHLSASMAIFVDRDPRSSGLLLKALLMILGMNREEREVIDIVDKGARDVRDDATDGEIRSVDVDDFTVAMSWEFDCNEGDLETRVLF